VKAEDAAWGEDLVGRLLNAGWNGEISVPNPAEFFPVISEDFGMTAAKFVEGDAATWFLWRRIADIERVSQAGKIPLS
jgi:hypothetical protein